ncbi:hypothetical protein V8E54_005854 [Elaphomyces granulatus]
MKSKHPSARKTTALSALPPLMIPLPPALPSRLGSAKAQALLRKFCSKRPCPRLRRQAGAVAAGHRPATPYAYKVDMKEERRDSCPATEEEGWPTDRLSSWGGRSGQGFHCANMKPLLDRTAHHTRSDKEAFGDPLRQPDRRL